ncbi:hypothetical protein [Acidovorax sp. A1169]|uniref:hypothetical protein n=1 Tax=Acidovorax sp. A1169 TaxID=3059524 RepID=UPI002737B169|nr:hypothetical protein [Acidovorax sp. A1169]MDP4078384.1 hypothetical protein [Acidovorax sp. A1169]
MPTSANTTTMPFHFPSLLQQLLGATHPHPMGPVDPMPEPQPGNPLPPEPVGPHPTPAPM